jgi:hypothetical protein
MRPIIHKYRECFSSVSFIFSLAAGVVSIILAYVLNYFTSVYATLNAGNQVTDIVLSNIPTYDVDMIFIYGPLILWIFIAVLCLKEPKRIPYVLKSVALFVIIRSLFVTLTHLGPYPYEIPLNYSSGWIKSMTFGGDLFFSGHTGLPFLIALIFGRLNKIYYFIFIAASVFFGVIVLLGHYHYSIDVAAAFFITYSIYVIASKWFKKDRDIFYDKIP